MHRPGQGKTCLVNLPSELTRRVSPLAIHLQRCPYTLTGTLSQGTESDQVVSKLRRV